MMCTIYDDNDALCSVYDFFFLAASRRHKECDYNIHKHTRRVYHARFRLIRFAVCVCGWARVSRVYCTRYMMKPWLNIIALLLLYNIHETEINGPRVYRCRIVVGRHYTQIGSLRIREIVWKCKRT